MISLNNFEINIIQKDNYMSNSKIKIFHNKLKENIYYINIKNEFIDCAYQLIILLFSPVIYFLLFNKDSSESLLNNLILELNKDYIHDENKLYLLLFCYPIPALILALIITFFSNRTNKENSKNGEKSKNGEGSARKWSIPILALTLIKKILSNYSNLSSILFASAIYITILYNVLKYSNLNEIKESDVIEIGNIIKPFWSIAGFWFLLFFFLKIFLNVYIEKRTNELKRKSTLQNLPNNKETTPCEVSGTTPLEAVFPQLKLANSKKQETIADLITHSCVWANDEYEIKLKDPENLKIELILVPKQSDTNQPQKSAEKTEK